MISCHEVKAHLIQLQDHEADAAYRVQVSDHLGQCAACAEVAKELDALWVWLDEYQGIEPSPYFKANFWREAHAMSPESPSFFSRWAALLSGRNLKAAALGASMIALLAIGIQIIPVPNDPELDVQLLQEVNRLVNADLDEPLMSLDENSTVKLEKREISSLQNRSK